MRMAGWQMLLVRAMCARGMLARTRKPPSPSPPRRMPPNLHSDTFCFTINSERGVLVRRGFSLVELSIVLVILGLLTGGILGGQALIRAAELRAVTTERDRYVTAMSTFRDKYFALPGDFTMATKFWGDQASGTAACADAAVADGTPGTCNGDGNGNVGTSGSGNPEALRAWQHLQMAGLVEGTYTGYTNGGSTPVVPSINAPKSKLGQAGWGIYYRGGTNNWVWQQSGNFLQVGASDVNGLFGGTLNPTDAWNIDTKTDDGIPVTGSLLAAAPTTQACVTPAPAAGAYTDLPANRTYDLTQTSTTLCALYFKLAL
ncbi:MAG: hypothetical protein DI582_07160 [Azospirillum brasilense]|nr:MAG: hypothetical protein DI582_07160 [Azospirillum brasilense]